MLKLETLQIKDQEQSTAFKLIPDTSFAIFSTLRQWEIEVESKHISVKYSVDGLEKYWLNGQPHFANAGHYLLVNKGQSVRSVVDSGQDVRGLCLYFDPQTLNNVWYAMAASDTQLLDSPIPHREMGFEFLEAVYPGMEDTLGRRLKQLYMRHLQGHEWEESHFWWMTESLLQSQQKVQQGLSRISRLKASTKEELFRRIMLAKRILDESYMEKWPIRDLAKAVAMSEFQFLRTFKEVYGLTPHQYQLKRRLLEGRRLLTTRRHSVNEAAHLVGFPDIYSFSKAFRKQFGIAPSKVG